jgi:3'-phosphoadenosine 5'-phosphosulfate sulfotransferase (PAPS reductase)/FAD synthetase
VEATLLELGIAIHGAVKGPYDIVVPLSGGKDSQCCLKLAVQGFAPNRVLALFCDTGFEHPETYAHVKNVTQRYGVDLVTLNAGTVFSICNKYKRFPGGGARHCTDELKIRPGKFFYRELAKLQGGFEVWIGVRTDESKEREKRYRLKVANEVYEPHEFMDKYPKYLAKMGVMFRLPVIDWAKSEVFEFLNGEENMLYGEGFSRVGCFPCLAGGEEDQVKAFNYDDTGRKHFKIALQIGAIAGRDVLTTKKFAGQGPACAMCSI